MSGLRASHIEAGFPPVLVDRGPELRKHEIVQQWVNDSEKYTKLGQGLLAVSKTALNYQVVLEACSLLFLAHLSREKNPYGKYFRQAIGYVHLSELTGNTNKEASHISVRLQAQFLILDGLAGILNANVKGDLMSLITRRLALGYAPTFFNFLCLGDAGEEWTMRLIESLAPTCVEWIE